MPSLKLTKTAVETAGPRHRDYELRDTMIPGFLCKVTPAGRKVFMLTYRTPMGERRKPSLGTFGQLTVDQARKLAQDHLAAVRGGADPSYERQAARGAPTMKDLSDRFMIEHSEARNKPSTIRSNRMNLKAHVLPTFGRTKVADVKRPDIAALIARMRATPTAANHTLSLLRKMFNLAELWGLRPDGTNPCRHIQKYAGGKRTRLITDEELIRLYSYLDLADAEGLEHPILTLAIRLQFEFAARMSEVLELRWEWIDLGNRRVVWPDSKTGGMSKPLSAEAIHLLESAPRYQPSEYVVPSLFDATRCMSQCTYSAGWRRILDRAGLPHCGTHAVRHRAATDIANSGVPVKVGMALTAHKTVTMFMRYVHTEDDSIRAAAETVAARRRGIVGGVRPPAAPKDLATPVAPVIKPVAAALIAPTKPLIALGDGLSVSPTKLGNYRPYRKRSGPNRPSPPKAVKATDPAAGHKNRYGLGATLELGERQGRSPKSRSPTFRG